MQMRNVRKYAKDADISLEGIKISLDRSPDLKGRNLFGYTYPSGKRITLYPDAFENIETLVKTIGHERTHVYQIQIFGLPQNSTIANKLYEAPAFHIEETFYQYYKNKK